MRKLCNISTRVQRGIYGTCIDGHCIYSSPMWYSKRDPYGKYIITSKVSMLNFRLALSRMYGEANWESTEPNRTAQGQQSSSGISLMKVWRRIIHHAKIRRGGMETAAPVENLWYTARHSQLWQLEELLGLTTHGDRWSIEMEQPSFFPVDRQNVATKDPIQLVLLSLQFLMD